MDISRLILFLVNFCSLGALCQEIIVHPSNTTAKAGETISLRCEFDEPINRCAWVRNNSPVYIGKRYQYSDVKSNGRNTTNCSLTIKEFHKIDLFNWQCYSVQGSQFSNSSYYNKSKTAYLTIDIVSVHPQNATVTDGGDIDLQCKIDKVNVSCVWLRNDSVINIKDRYRFHKLPGNNENNGDCSIKIIQFKEIDATRWQCSCALNSDIENEKCKSNPAFLSLKPAGINAEFPVKTTEMPEESTFSMDLTNTLLCSVIALLLSTILLLVVIYCRCVNKARKKKASYDQMRIVPTSSNNQSSHNSSSNFHQSAESLCDKCHQYKPDPLSPGSVRSLPKFDHRDKPMPLPQLDNHLPSYDEAKLYNEGSSGQQNTQLASGLLTDHCKSREEIMREHPIVGRTTLTNASGSATCNPLYEPLPMADANNPDVDGATEVVLLDSQYRDVIFTRIIPKK